MKSIIHRYSTDGVRFFLCTVGEDITQKIMEMHGVGKEDASRIAAAASFAECLASAEKDDRASVYVSFRNKQESVKYSAIAEKDGRLRGCTDNSEPCAAGDNIIVEVTKKLSLRGDYTSVVTGRDINGAIGEYMKNSQQTVSFCEIIQYENGAMCAIAEQFPITTPEQEKYRFAAEAEWQRVSPLFSEDNPTAAFDGYEKLEEIELCYGCTCTRRSITAALDGIDREDLLNSADENGCVEVKCKYCGKKYNISIT